MIRNTSQRTVHSICRRMHSIDLQPEFQRESVWSKSQKQLLIDSILNDLDIPKIYINEKKAEGTKEELVDGQQRLTAINEFLNDAYPLKRDTPDINGDNVAGKFYSSLDESTKDRLDSYELTVVSLREASNNEVEEMFLRLQNGTPLNPSEKRNAMPGNITRFVRELARHPLFENCNFKNHRFAFDNVAAQMLRIAVADNPQLDIGAPALRALYVALADFDLKCKTAKRVQATLNFLVRAFPEKTPELTKQTVLTLFSIAYYYQKHYITKGTEADFAKTFLSFEQERKEDLIKPRDARNDLLINYQEAIAKSTLSQKSVSGRYLAVMSFYQEHLLEPPLRYPQRHFTEEQRLFIYRRDHGICQLQIKCQGKKCGWEEWHTDHIKPHSKGGQTTVENGQVSCPECNFVKGDMAID